ncbi:hypothetical protein BN970_01772 [Mycolicibacterium conceptionense]|uniref:Uncharacterized protein n=1 Tax=Mycolicibacterium conceptionense TaxID=451644 RepID=A0A0U1D845_9MYCO|nr:hypothetical protein BN970_01772 [Mycolicibacterium conceptionense]
MPRTVGRCRAAAQRGGHSGAFVVCHHHVGVPSDAGGQQAFDELESGGAVAHRRGDAFDDAAGRDLAERDVDAMVGEFVETVR